MTRRAVRGSGGVAGGAHKGLNLGQTSLSGQLRKPQNAPSVERAGAGRRRGRLPRLGPSKRDALEYYYNTRNAKGPAGSVHRSRQMKDEGRKGPGRPNERATMDAVKSARTRHNEG